MSLNGRMPASALAPIPGGRLRKDAAAAWNAMHTEILTDLGVDIQPAGPRSSYRLLKDQVDLRNEWCAAGKCGNAAVPGTSNHGEGLAVDVATPAMREAIDKRGARFGWAKKWSDAPNEWWHLKWKPGVWTPLPALTLWSHGKRVRHTSAKLVTLGYLKRSRYVYGPAMVEAISKFQRTHHLTVDGVAGPQTIAWLTRFAAKRKAAKR